MFPEHFSFDSYEEALQNWIDKNLNDEVFSPGFKRVSETLSPYRKRFEKENIPIVTIGGTNGKGEVCGLLERNLDQANYDVFMWCSPHILSVRERFSIRGKPIDGERLLNLLNNNKEKTKLLSYYEFLFLIFCEVVTEEIKSSKKPLILLEVGLGGRLDATNVFNANVAAIVSIGRDHVKLLGPSLKNILHEKFGIAREGKPLISGVKQSFLRDELVTCSKSKGIELLDIYKEDPSLINKNYKICNLSVARRVFGIVNTEHSATRATQNKLPFVEGPLWGRPIKMTTKDGQFIFIGSHNLDGLRSLAEWVNGSTEYKFKRVILGLSRSSKKEIVECLRLVQESRCLGEEIYLTRFNHPRASDLELVKQAVTDVNKKSERKVKLDRDWKNIIAKCSRSNDDEVILFTGSYFFIGCVLSDPYFKSLFNSSDS